MSRATKSTVKSPPIGILYICTGKRDNLLRNSLGSLKATNSTIPVFLLADRPYDVPFKWVQSWTGMASRRIKTRLCRYSPFELTLYVDADTVFVHSINLNEMLGDADLALAEDYCSNLKQASCLIKWPHHVSRQEVDETISLCGENHVFFNSGVMLWRKSPQIRNFFDRWHEEWLKYQQCDQFALVRALQGAKISLKIISTSYNSPVYDDVCAKTAHIHHLLGKESVAKRFGLWNLPAAGIFEAAFTAAVETGQMALNQYRYVARQIYNHRPCNLLVIGNGSDIDFWSHCVGQNFHYVTEPGQPIISVNQSEFKFQTQVGKWAPVPVPPPLVNRKWDYVIVSGPRGYDNSCPGRQIPIAWASQLTQKMIFVMDYERLWERKICDHYLGTSNHVADADGRKDKKLAIFNMALPVGQASRS